jgi:hypothetical protein
MPHMDEDMNHKRAGLVGLVRKPRQGKENIECMSWTHRHMFAKMNVARQW